MEGRGQINLSVYYYKWENIKGRSSFAINETCRPADIGGTGCDPALGQSVGDPKRIPSPDGTLVPFSNARNILLPGNATVSGAELELTYRVTDTLLWKLNGAYTSSEYDDYVFNFVAPIAGFSQMKGNQTPRQPEWSGNSSLVWDFQLFAMPAYLRGDVIYQGEAYVDESNLAKIEDYWLLNLRAGIEAESFSVELFSTNLTDEEAWGAGARWTDFGSPTQFPFFTTKQGVSLSPLDKRQVGLRVNYRF
jgi:outer membrane receptor protein involved in Fe transport